MSNRLLDKVLGFIGFEDEPDEGEEQEELQEQVVRTRKGPAVVSLHTQRQMRVVVAEPRSFVEAQEIADHLKNRKPVVVNLERVEMELAQRIIDFVSGAVYALGGSVQKVSAHILLFAPSNVDIAAESGGAGEERAFIPWLKNREL
ncbi:cell division protein SepF [Desulfothermobacter acidiphilus]|uniref:cell division protein SepF n=1 Tax=Desulfothermobacter acidiphilus TaxID=1938353 RepID=UPI003F8A6D49